VLEDSYHIVTIDRQRHVVVERVTAFVEKVSEWAREPASAPKEKGMEEAPQTVTITPVPH
jgi:carboxylesterase